MQPQINTNALLDLYRGSLYHLLMQDRAGFVAIFKRNGVEMPDTLSDDAIYASILAGMVASPSFRKDINTYLKSQAQSEFQGFTGNEDFFNADGGSSFGTFLRGMFRSNSANATGDECASTTAKPATLKQVFNSDRLGSYFDAAANLLVSSIGSKMQQKGEQNAINYELAQKQKFEAQAKACTVGIKALSQKKILVPALIVTSLLLVGGVVWYIAKKKKAKA